MVAFVEISFFGEGFRDADREAVPPAIELSLHGLSIADVDTGEAIGGAVGEAVGGQLNGSLGAVLVGVWGGLEGRSGRV